MCVCVCVCVCGGGGGVKKEGKKDDKRQANETNAFFLFSKILFPNFKAFVSTEAQTPNSKLLNEVESNLPL